MARGSAVQCDGCEKIVLLTNDDGGWVDGNTRPLGWMMVTVNGIQRSSTFDVCGVDCLIKVIADDYETAVML